MNRARELGVQASVLFIPFALRLILPSNPAAGGFSVTLSISLLLLVLPVSSPWIRWQGALPVDRRAWLARESAYSFGGTSCLVLIAWLVQGYFASANHRIAPWLWANAGFILASLGALPIILPLQLKSGMGLTFMVPRFLMCFGASFAITGIGTVGARVDHVVGAGLGGCCIAISLAFSHAWSRRLLLA